jgi:hypothetical protein
VLERQLGEGRVRFTPGDGAFLAALLHRLPLEVLRRVRLLVCPDTVLRRHRDLVARGHAAASGPKRSGRPRTVRCVRLLGLRLPRENPGWRYRRIHGEVLSRDQGGRLHRLGDPPGGWDRPGTGTRLQHVADFLSSQADALWCATSWRRSRCPWRTCTCFGDRACPPADRDPGRYRAPECRLGEADSGESRHGT